MEEKLMELPFGEKFAKKWDECVEFYKYHNRDVRISSQNSAIRYMLQSCNTEEEALLWVDDFCDMVIRYPDLSRKKDNQK